MLATASLLASLFISSAAPTVFGATDSTTYLDNCNPTSCSMVADGISRLTVEAQVGAALPVGANLQYDIAGATFSTTVGQSTGAFAAGSITSTTIKTLANVIPGDADLFTVISPTAAGTATITVRIVPAVGVATTEGTFTIDFYSADQLAVSITNSTNVLSVASASATGGDAVATLTTTVKNSVGTGGTGVVGATVTWTISPYGTLTAGHVQTFTSPATVAGGIATVTINAAGIPGTSTITTSVTYQSVTTTFAAKTFSFYGPLAKVTLSARFVSQVAGTTRLGALKLVAEDAAGNKIDGLPNGTNVLSAVLPAGSVIVGLTPTVGFATTGSVAGSTTYGPGTGAMRLDAACDPALPLRYGKASVQVKIVRGTTTITSNAVDLYCADDVAKTFTITAGATAVVPGGNTGITVNILEKNGLPVPDGYEAVVLTNSGAVFGDVVGNSATTFGGDATWTFLAPSTAGIATLTGFVSNANTVGGGTLLATQSVSITIGTVAPTSTFNTTGTALGNTLTGPFTAATKISTGGYITWRFDGGTALAGKTIEIWAYKKVGLATNPWSAAYLLTTRVANASGVAFANITSGSVIWLSIRPVLPATATDAAVWGSWSIGRWVH